MVQQEMEATNMRHQIYILILLLLTVCCSSKETGSNYSVKIHYQYVVFKKNAKTYNIRVENFLNIRNNTKDTLIIPHRDIKNHLKMIYKNSDTISLSYMSNKDIKILPLDSLDLNCAANLNRTINDIPSKLNIADYKIYNNLTKKYLSNTSDYEIIKTTKFGIFREQYLK